MTSTECREVTRAELDVDVLELVLRPPADSRERGTFGSLGALSAVVRTGTPDRRRAGGVSPAASGSRVG